MAKLSEKLVLCRRHKEGDAYRGNTEVLDKQNFCYPTSPIFRKLK